MERKGLEGMYNRRRIEDGLLGIGVLNLMPLSSLGRLDGLPDGLANLLTEELRQELVAELGPLAHERHRARVAQLFCGQSDTGGGGLDPLGILVLGVDSNTDESRAINRADEVFGGLLIVGVVHVLGQVELEGDVTSLHGFGVGDVDVAGGDGLVKADVGPLAGKRQGERDIGALLDRHAGDRVRLDDAVHLLLGNEESTDAKEQDEGHEDPQDLPSQRPLLAG